MEARNFVLNPSQVEIQMGGRGQYHLVQTPMPDRERCTHGHAWKVNARWRQFQGWTCRACVLESGVRSFQRRYVPHPTPKPTFEQIMARSSALDAAGHRLWSGALSKGHPLCLHKGKRVMVRRMVWDHFSAEKLTAHERIVRVCAFDRCIAYDCLTKQPFVESITGKAKNFHFAVLPKTELLKVIDRSHESCRVNSALRKFLNGKSFDRKRRA